MSHMSLIFCCIALTYLSVFLLFSHSAKQSSLINMGSPGGSVVKNLRAIAESGRHVRFLVWEDPLEGMATHSSILAWQIPWTEEPGRLQSMESQSWTQVSNWTTSPEIFISVSSALSSLYKAINLINTLINAQQAKRDIQSMLCNSGIKKGVAY